MLKYAEQRSHPFQNRFPPRPRLPAFYSDHSSEKIRYRSLSPRRWRGSKSPARESECRSPPPEYAYRFRDQGRPSSRDSRLEGDFRDNATSTTSGPSVKSGTLELAKIGLGRGSRRRKEAELTDLEIQLRRKKELVSARSYTSSVIPRSELVSLSIPSSRKLNLLLLKLRHRSLQTTKPLMQTLGQPRASRRKMGILLEVESRDPASQRPKIKEKSVRLFVDFECRIVVILFKMIMKFHLIPRENLK